MAGRDNPAIVLIITLVVTLWRTCLVLDALRGRSGLVSRASRRLSVSTSESQQPPSPKHQRRAGTGTRSFIR